MQLLHYYPFFYTMCTTCLAFLQKSQLTQFTSDNRIVRLNMKNCSIDVYSREAQVDYFSTEYQIALRENCGKGNDVKFSVAGSCALICFVKQDCQRYNIKNDGYPCTMDIFLSISNSSTLIETNGNKVLLAGHITQFNQILIIDFTTGDIVSKSVEDSLAPQTVYFNEDNVIILHLDRKGSKDNLILWCLDSNLNMNMRFTVDTNLSETIVSALTKDNFLFIYFAKTLVVFHIDLDKRTIGKKLDMQLSSSAVLLHADEELVLLKQYNEILFISVEKNCVVGRMELTKDTDCLELLFSKSQSELLALSSDRRWKVTPLTNTKDECIPTSQLIFSQWINVTSEDYSCLIRTNYETFESEISKCIPLNTASEQHDLVETTTTTALPEFLFGTWSSWSEWTRCDCITRINKRRRFCMGASCEGCDWELSSCQSKCATVKRLQGWSEWHPINETKMLRTRSWCSSSTPCDSGIIREHRQIQRIQHVSSKDKAPMTTSWTPWSHHDGTWVRARLLPNGSLEVSAYPARVFCVNSLPMWCMVCAAFLGGSAYACLAALSSLRIRPVRAPSPDWM